MACLSRASSGRHVTEVCLRFVCRTLLAVCRCAWTITIPLRDCNTPRDGCKPFRFLCIAVSCVERWNNLTLFFFFVHTEDVRLRPARSPLQPSFCCGWVVFPSRWQHLSNKGYKRMWLSDFTPVNMCSQQSQGQWEFWLRCPRPVMTNLCAMIPLVCREESSNYSLSPYWSEMYDLFTTNNLSFLHVSNV